MSKKYKSAPILTSTEKQMYLEMVAMILTNKEFI